MPAIGEPSRDEVVGWASRTFPGPDWSRARSLSGAFHQVLVMDDVVLRAAHGDGHAERGGREAGVLRAWCGGHGFASVVADLPIEAFGAHRALADRVVGDLLALSPPTELRLVHGDFGPHNLLWSGSRAVSLIDLDHSCAGDRAIDLAPLVGIHGAAAIAAVAPEDVVDRAMVHRATLSLQVAAAAHLADRPHLRDHALSTFARRAGEGTLHDPGGAVPQGWRRTGQRSVRTRAGTGSPRRR